jgi:RadC-like JAB domain
MKFKTMPVPIEPREQFRVLYLDKRNNLIADEIMHEGTVDHRRCIRGRFCGAQSRSTPPAACSSTITRLATPRHPAPISTCPSRSSRYAGYLVSLSTTM